MSFFPILTLQHPFATSWPSSPRWEACHWILGSLCSPTNPVPLPPKGDARESSTILPELTPLPCIHSPTAKRGGKVVAPATKGGPPEWCRKSMTQRFLSAHPRCPLRGHRVYGAKRRCDTPLLSGPPIGGLLYFEFLSDSYPPAPLRHFVALFP